jgi:hypothetical protein
MKEVSPRCTSGTSMVGSQVSFSSKRVRPLPTLLLLILIPRVRAGNNSTGTEASWDSGALSLSLLFV